MPGRNDSVAKYFALPFTQRHTGDAALPTVLLGAMYAVETEDCVLAGAGVGLGVGVALGDPPGSSAAAGGAGVGVAVGCCAAGAAD